MIIGVLGAGGRTGVYVVEEALRRGHHVVAGVRGPHPFTANDQLKVIECNILDSDSVEAFVTTCEDTIISVIGHVKQSPPRLQTDGMRNLVTAMSRHRKTRILSLTGTGVREQGDIIPWYDSILNLAVKVVDPNRVSDGIEHANVLASSELNWTILRVLKLQTRSQRSFQLTAHGPTKLYVSRRDVATALLDIAEQNLFVRQLPILSKKH